MTDREQLVAVLMARYEEAMAGGIAGGSFRLAPLDPDTDPGVLCGTQLGIRWFVCRSRYEWVLAAGFAYQWLVPNWLPRARWTQRMADFADVAIRAHLAGVGQGDPVRGEDATYRWASRCLTTGEASRLLAEMGRPTSASGPGVA